MTELALLMVIISLGLSITFALKLGPPWLSQNPPMTWLQAGLAWTAASVDLGLLLSGLGIEIPLAVVLLILLAQDIIFAWRLWALYRAGKRAEKEEETRTPTPEEYEP